MDMYEIVKKNPVLAILRNIPLEKTIDYAQAIADGGISFFEVALNSPEACRQIRMLRDHFGDKCLIGAGTAITVERVKEASDAGAQFYLTPGTPPDVLAYCADRKYDVLPGVLTPCDVALCAEYGYKTMKLFPAGSMPRNYVRDLKGPFDDTNYVAIGGVTPENIRSFFEAGCIGAGLAGSLMPREIIEKSDWKSGSCYVRKLVENALREEN